MRVENLLNIIGVEFFTGVPDSLLQPVYDYLIQYYSRYQHIIAANEGNAIAIGAGYYLSTGKVPLIYLQNSGLGNTINPIASLMNEKVYAMPCILLIGYRGEDGIKDEPQHTFQGEITEKTLKIMNINYFIIDKSTTEEDVKKKMIFFRKKLGKGHQVAFIVKKGALTADKKGNYSNNYHLVREDVLKEIVKFSGEDVMISTTGKASRELFEIRESNNQPHKYDFLTVGSMGHASSIALGIAIKKPDKTVWCIDGDGAMLMHMGAMSVIGTSGINNIIHILINNASHESVGGAPTCADKINIVNIASACGYKSVVSVETRAQLSEALNNAKRSCELTFIEIKCKIGSRDDLGRPTQTPIMNKNEFMNNIR